MQLKGDVFSNERLEKSCVVFREARTEFGEPEMNVGRNEMQQVSWRSATPPTAYKVRLEEFNGDSSLDLYKMTILSVIKEG